MTRPPLLLDTSIMLALLRAKGVVYEAVGREYGVSKDIGTDCFLCAVSLGELLALGIKFNWAPERLERLRADLLSVAWVGIDHEDIREAYAKIDHFSERVCKPARRFGQNDIWIAAVAHVTGATLLTTDRDFDHLAGPFIQRDFLDPTTGKLNRDSSLRAP